MAINKQPPKPILPAYRPVAFELYFDTLTSASRGENARVTIYKNGAPITTKPIIYKSSRNEVSPLSPTDTRWFFNIDIQKKCQDTLAPYPSLSSGFVSPLVRTALNSDMFAVYYFTVLYDIVDLSTGLLEDSAIDQEVSNEFTVFSASKGNLETMFLDDYYGTYAGQDTRFLTKSSRTIEICKAENVFLTVIAPPDTPPFPSNFQALKVSLFDSSGTLIEEALTAPSTVILASEQTTLNVGVSSLKTAFYVFGTPDFDDTELSYYTVSLGMADYNTTINSYVQHTELFTYKLTPSCCSGKSLRLHWMNRLGGIDSFTFDDSKDLQEITQSQRGKQALGWNTGSTAPHKTSSQGTYKYDSQSIQQYLISAILLKNSQALWLSELLSSSKVYIDIDNTFTLVSCTVQDTTQSITRNDGKIPYNLILTLSNNPINPRL